MIVKTEQNLLFCNYIINVFYLIRFYIKHELNENTINANLSQYSIRIYGRMSIIIYELVKCQYLLRIRNRFIHKPFKSQIDKLHEIKVEKIDDLIIQSYPLIKLRNSHKMELISVTFKKN